MGQSTRRDRDVVGVAAKKVNRNDSNYAPVTVGHGNRISANVGKGFGNAGKSGTANKR